MKTKRIYPVNTTLMSVNDTPGRVDAETKTVSQALKRNRAAARSLYASQSCVAVRNHNPPSRGVLQRMLDIIGPERTLTETGPNRVPGENWLSRVRNDVPGHE